MGCSTQTLSSLIIILCNYFTTLSLKVQSKFTLNLLTPRFICASKIGGHFCPQFFLYLLHYPCDQVELLLLVILNLRVNQTFNLVVMHEDVNAVVDIYWLSCNAHRQRLTI